MTRSWANGLLLAFSVFSSLPQPASAYPIVGDDDPGFNSSHPFEKYGLDNFRYHGQKRDQSIPLRILSLGASIMSGTGSSTGNGCRKPLRDALRTDGWQVDMVGSLHSGTMLDYEHEAVPGDVLTGVLARVPNSTGFKPNIVIINAGTNDANGPIDPPNAGVRMTNVLNALWNADGMADTCIMLSTLIPTTNANGLLYDGTINDQYRSLVTQLAAQGKCIYLAEMWPNGDQWLQFDTDYLTTEDPHVHPNDKGHAMMAAVFYNTINQALADNRVVAPGDFSVGAASCAKYAGTGADAGGYTQRGSGYDDGIYYHDSEELGIKWTWDSPWDRAQWKFGRLFDRNYDDLLAWVTDTDTSQLYNVWPNSADGQGNFVAGMSQLVPDLNCEHPEGVHFIDMNADGLDDLVYIDADGNAYLSINQGDGNRVGGKSPTFKRVSDTALIRATTGSTRDFMVLADIDGDGRGDIGVIDASGAVTFWRNAGLSDIPAWQPLGVRWNDQGLGTVTNTRFEDINGDGRDDAMWVSDTGSVYTWTNSRSCAASVLGNGLQIAWRQGFYTGESSGPTHKGFPGYVTTDEPTLESRVHFARVIGQSTVFGNLPPQDTVLMEHILLDSGSHRFNLRVWKNTGGGGSKIKADGNRYCNMMGHAEGHVDYVWVYSYGIMVMWGNREKGKISDSDADGYWEYKGEIFRPPNNINRKDLHLADWDGDGACDVIYADPDTGAVQVWINNYPTTQTWDWTPITVAGLSCSEKRGLGTFDLAIRFADITGNGKADYLCIQPDSTVTGFIHNDDGSLTNAGQVKVSIGYDRANMRFADVNGDGKDDLIWADKFTGDAYVWYAAGPGSALGSSYIWQYQDEAAYAGLAAGHCIYFADLDGSGRADEHYVLESFNNIARTSLSPSCGLTDVTGDDAAFYGALPTVPTTTTSTGGGGSGDDGSGDDGTDKITSLAVALAIDTCDPTDPNKAWRCVTCNEDAGKALMSPIIDPYTKWDTSNASFSYSMFMTAYEKTTIDGTVSWGDYLSAFYGSTVILECAVGSAFDTINCNTDVNCDGSSIPVAAYMVLSSYIRVYSFYQAWWNALDSVLTDWGSIGMNFASTFVHTKSNIGLQMDAWLFDTVMDSVGGQVWNKLSKSASLPEDSPKTEKAEEIFNSAYGEATEKLKNVLGLDKLDPDPDEELSDMTVLAKAIVKYQQNSVSAYANWLLNDSSPEAMAAFSNQIRYGTYFNLPETSTEDIRLQAKKLTIAGLVTYSWQYEQSLWPVIVVANDDDADLEFSHNLYKLSDDEVSGSRAIYDGKTFYLLGVLPCDVYDTKARSCPSATWTSLSGYDQLDGTHEEWGNLTMSELIESSWEGYKLNGYANGYNITEHTDAYTLTDGDSGDTSIYRYVNGVLSPGYFSVPMCTLGLASINWNAVIGDEDFAVGACDNFPCCTCEELGLSSCDDEVITTS